MKTDHRQLVFKKAILGRTFLINKQFQFRFMGQVMFAVALTLICVYLANSYFFQTYLTRGEEMGLPTGHVYFAVLDEQRIFMNKVYLALGVGLIAIFGIWGLFFSHRIAGPLYRLQRVFKEAKKNGQLDQRQLKFRDNDFFHEIPESICDYLDSTQTKKVG